MREARLGTGLPRSGVVDSASKIHGCRRLDRQLGGHTFFDAEIGSMLFNGMGTDSGEVWLCVGATRTRARGRSCGRFFDTMATVGDELPPPYSVGPHATGPGDPRTNLARKPLPSPSSGLSAGARCLPG